MNDTSAFQNHIPGNICFGCGTENQFGLQIKSYWEGDIAVCNWKPEPKYDGWKGVLCGGITATLIDCHCMNTAMAHAYKIENRTLDSDPKYKYATGSLNIRYLKPISSDHIVELKAVVTEVKKRKTVMACEVFSNGIKAAEAEVIGIRVYDSSKVDNDEKFGVEKRNNSVE